MSRLYNILNKLATPETATPSITSSTGTLNDASITKVGRVITLTVSVKNSSNVAAGSNIFSGTIENKYKPSANSYGLGYNGASVGVLAVVDTGSIVVRCAGAALGANNTMVASVTYIV